MAFQSYVFPVFLLAVVAVYYAVPTRLRVGVLLPANLIFFCFADWRASVWIGLAIFATWGTGLLLERVRRGMRRWLLAACLLFHLTLLALFRYLPVWEELINGFYGGRLQAVHLDAAGAFGWAAPLGISFYTLEAVGYLTDVYQGKCGPQRSLLRMAVFLSFFPNLASGPIERAERFFAQLDRNEKLSRRALWDYDRAMQGLIAILLGFYEAGDRGPGGHSGGSALWDVCGRKQLYHADGRPVLFRTALLRFRRLFPDRRGSGADSRI